MAKNELPHVVEELSGWGRSPRREGRRYRPAKLSNLRQLVGSGALIARGAGRSYGDAALPGAGPEASVIDLTALDRFLSFDVDRGIVRAEAGVTLQQLLSITVPRGWFLPVVPGTAACTLGGMVAADVHGKNHKSAGSFQNAICSLTLLLPNGDEIVCSPLEDAELFAATCGGMGLTGVVVDGELALEPIESAWVRTETSTFTGLDGFLAALGDAPQEHVVGWVDGLVPHAQLGKSVLIAGDLASVDDYRAEVSGSMHVPPLYAPWATPRRLPRAASLLLRPATMRLYNRRHYRRATAAREKLVSIQDFFFPLDQLASWNQLYGKEGFVQYQFAVPTAAASTLLRRAIDALQHADLPPYLVVVKRLGEGHGMLSFPTPGITVAIDVPQRNGLAFVLDALDRDVVEHGGRVYLAKDSRVSADLLPKMYPHLGDFIAVQQRVDPDGRMTSAMSERLRLTQRDTAAEGEGA